MRRFSLLLIILSLALTACGQSKPTNYYLLKSTAVPVAAESMPRTTLGIVGVNLPGYLDRSGIVLLDENGTLINVPQFNKWAESLDEGAARLLRRSLTPVLLRQGITVLASEDTRVAAAYGVIVDIVRLEATTGGSIALEARWTLIDPGANRILGRGSFAGGEKISMPEIGSREMFNAVVAGESRLLERFGTDLGRRIAALAARRN